MAGKTGRPIPDIKERLLDESSRFSFIQAYRLLIHLISKENNLSVESHEIEKRIFVHPQLSLTYPESDVCRIDELSSNNFLMEVTFLGLYGTSSPLPSFYTEDLLHEQSEDLSVSRDFIDIINYPIYQIFFKCWCKSHLFYSIVERTNSDILQRLYCLLGIEGEKLRDRVENPYGLLRYIGLTTHFPRSAESLRTLLSDALNESSINIEQCVTRVAKIPEDQLFSLGVSGNIIGNNCFLGNEIVDNMGKFRVHAGPFNSESFHRFLPHQPLFHKMKQLINFYMDKAFIWDFKMYLKGDNIKTTCLGSNKWSSLGWESWIFSPGYNIGDASLILNPEE
jgi:type VI secretion system protein ImpH